MKCDIEYIVDKAVLLNEGRVVKKFYPEQVREEGNKKSIVRCDEGGIPTA